MRTKKEHSHWPLSDVVVIIIACIIAIALAYTVVMKLRIISKH
jgi:Ca2+/H+ antiporter